MQLQILSGLLVQRLARAAVALCHAPVLAWLCPLRTLAAAPGEGQSPKQIPRSRPVRRVSPSRGTQRMRPATSARGT